jgi:frataxin-like iron-binding protein CyaY
MIKRKLKNVCINHLLLSQGLKSFISRKKVFINVSSPEERLSNKAKNVSESTGQVQNYEKHIFIKQNFDETENVSSTLENLLEHIESTNSQYMKLEDNKSSNDLTFNEYIKNSEKMMLKLRKAFEVLLSQDNNLSLDLGANQGNLNFLKVEVKSLGVYIISREFETKTLTVTSPISGLFKYKYDSKTNYWISVKDTHILDELLMREFCQHSKGYLNIENN